MTDRVPDPGNKPDAILPLVRHVLASRYEDLSPKAAQATKTFILDSFGVIITGTLAPRVPQTLQVLRGWGGKEESTVLVFGGKLPSPSAAMMNSFMLHNQEFDCRCFIPSPQHCRWLWPSPKPREASQVGSF